MPLNEYDELLTTGKAPSANPYDDLLGDVTDQQAVTLRTSMREAAKTPPDTKAKHLQIADRLKVPVELVERNPDLFTAKDTLESLPYEDLITKSPKLAEWLSHPQNAGVAHDDVLPLTGLERTLGVGRNLLGSAGAGVLGFGQGVAGLVQSGAEMIDAATGPFITAPGRIAPGNIDLFAQPKVKNADGSISTVDSFSVEIDGKEVLLPTVMADGRHLSQPEALAEYQKTGRHLGVFDTPANASQYAQQLHNQYAAGIYDSPTFAAHVASLAQRAAVAAEHLATRARGPQEDMGLVERSIYGGIESVGQMAPAVIAGILAGPGVALGLMGGSTGGQAYTQARAQGVGVGKAAGFGAFQGTIEVATEYIPAHRLFKDLGKHAGLIETIVHQLKPELVGENIATIAQDFAEWMVLPANKERPAMDYVRERPSAAVATTIGTIVAMGATTIAGHGAARFIEKLGQDVEQSKTAQRLPEAVQDFVTQATQDGGTEHLYAPVDTWTTYWQSKGVDPAKAAADVTGDPEAYRRALQTGEDLVIPTAAYAVKLAGTEHNAFFQNELRVAPEQMNGREADDFQKQQLETLSPEPRAQADASPVREDISAQLQAAGYERATAENYATLYESTFQTLGERAGLDPVELFKRYGLQVTREGSKVATDGEQAGNPDARGGTAADAGIDASRGGRSGAQNRRLSRRAQRELDTFTGLVTDAVAAGYTGDPQTLIAKLSDRAQTVREIDAEVDAAGGSPEALIREIVKAGGLSLSRESENTGELRWLKESALAKRWGFFTGKAGLPLDGMVEALQQDPSFGHIETINDLLDELSDIAAGATPMRGEMSARRLGAVGEQWWELFQSDAQRLQQGERGRITFGDDRRHFNIELLQNADLSTFLHESAHFFLEVMRDLSAESPDVAADLATLDAGLFDGATSEVDKHERFARGFEAYLLEGNAPSADLRAVFAKFRAWLVGVYRSLRQLNVTLTPDVRRVFDRLVASDDAIAAAEAEGHVAPLFLDLATAGMTPAQFAGYQVQVRQASEAARDDLQRRVLREVQREQQATWKAAKEEMRAVVAGEIHQQPVYQAQSAIRKGTLPDGTPLPGDPGPMKLAKSALADRYGPNVLATLRRSQLYTVDGGVHPDTIAELFGFSSGDELVQALAAVPPMAQAIEAETTARMTAKYGDILQDGTLAEAAQAAVFGEQRQAVVQAELKALTKGMAVGVIPSASLLRSMAEQRIGATRVRDLRPGHFLMAAQRASQRAFQLVATGTDRVAAVVAKQQELLNLALYRAATQAKEDADKGVAWIQDNDSTAARQRLGKAGQDYLDQWDGVLDRYEFARVSQTVLDRRTSLAKWIASLEAQGLPVDLPAALVEESRRVNWQSLPIEELRGVVDGLKSLRHLARLKNRLLTQAEHKNFTEAVTAIDASIRDKNVVKKLPLEFLPKDQKARKVNEWFASHNKIATLARALDGYDDGGKLWEYIIRPINEAATKEAVLNTEATHALSKLMTTAYSGRELARLHDKTFIPAIHDSLSKEGRLAVALNWGNEGNRQRIRDGRHWTDQQVQAILGTLDERDWTFVQGVWDFIDGYWPDIKAKQERVTGLAPEKVEATPVVTPFGTFNGGYYPLAYDQRLSARAGAFLDANEATLQKHAAYVKATTRRGHTEARAAAVSEPVRLELSVLYGHVEQVIHDLSHHEMLIDVGRVLGDKRVQAAIYETKGDLVYQQFKGALKDIAYGTRPAADSIERGLNFIRQGTTVAGLAWNTWTAVQQPIGVFNGMARVGPQWVLKGMTRLVRDAASMENTAAWIADKSNMMAHRGATFGREVSELRNTLGHAGGWFDNALRTVTLDKVAQQDISDSYFFLIEQAQRLADMPTWLGQYEKSMASGEEEARAIALADQAVLDAQGGGQIKDLAQAQRGSAAVKLFTNFYSYGNLLYNQTSEAYGKTNFRRAGSVGQFLGNLVLLYVFPASMSVLLAKAFSKGDDDEAWVTAIGKEILGQALNTMVLVRELGGFVKAANRGYDGPAGTRAIAAAYNLGTQLKQGEGDRGLLRATEDVGGILFRLPVAQVQRSVDGFVALQEGQTHNPLVLLTGAPKAAAR